MFRYDSGLECAVTKLKERLGPGLASEVDTCLAEARECNQRHDSSRPVSRGDNLIAPAVFIDAEEVDTLQGALSAIVDRGVLGKLCEFYSDQNSSHDVNRLVELCDESTSHDWVCSINPVFGPVIEPDLYLTAIKLRIGVPFFCEVSLCSKCRTKDMDCNCIHALCCNVGCLL